MTHSPVNVTITVQTENETESFETLERDQLSKASGGFYQTSGSWGGYGGYSPYGGYGGYGGYGWQPQPQFYTVKRGDNLTKIARNSHQSLQQLLAWNPQYQSNPNLIHPGEYVLTGVNYPRYY